MNTHPLGEWAKQIDERVASLDSLIQELVKHMLDSNTEDRAELMKKIEDSKRKIARARVRATARRKKKVQR